jgi:hypothetical protein
VDLRGAPRRTCARRRPNSSSLALAPAAMRNLAALVVTKLLEVSCGKKRGS